MFSPNLFKNVMSQTHETSAVGIATGYGLYDRSVGVQSPGKVKIFLFSTSPIPVLRPTQPPIQWVTGTIFPGKKRPGHETYHSSSTSAKVKITLIYAYTLPCVFMA
jgi:hypothetical protein